MSQGPGTAADLGVLADLAPELAATFVSIASDIALVIDPDGVIRNVTVGDAPITRHAGDWVGQPFINAVTADTRGKIQQLLDDVDSTGVSRSREVNLPGTGGQDIPMTFAAIRLGTHGPVLAVGRDLRAIAAIQQRFLDAQQELERDYWQQRQAESRYRMLFQVAHDAVLVVDAASLEIVEANRAAALLLGQAGARLEGQPLRACMASMSRPAVDQLLVSARTSGRPAEIRAWVAAAPAQALPRPVDISATPFRATLADGERLLLLVRARDRDAQPDSTSQRLAEFVEHTPDGVAITDSSGRLLMANPALLAMCPGRLSEAQLKGRTLSDLLGDGAARIDALVAEVRRQGIANQVRLVLAGTGGAVLEVEISAAWLDEGDQACIGFTLRRHALASAADTGLAPVNQLAAAIETLANQLGRVSLPELMQEATHLAERHLIRSALQQSQGDLRLAANRLGIAAESLSLRLQRHGLAADHDGGPPPLLN